MPSQTFQSTTSTNYEDGHPSYPSSLRSGWFIANATANTASPKAGAFYNFSVDEVGTFEAPVAGVSTILLRHRRSSQYTSSSQNVQVALVGRYKVNENDYSEWMILPNRNKDDGIATAITLTADFTNDIADNGYRFTETDDDSHWFDTKGCNEFAVLVTTAFAGSPSVSGTNVSVIEAKFL